MTAPRSVAFRVDWEPDPDELRVVRDYLINQPEQGDWAWEDHCDGLAGGILQALHVHRHGIASARPPAGEMPEPLLQRMLTQAARHGKEIERLRTELEQWRAKDAALDKPQSYIGADGHCLYCGAGADL